MNEYSFYIRVPGLNNGHTIRVTILAPDPDDAKKEAERNYPGCNFVDQVKLKKLHPDIHPTCFTFFQPKAHGRPLYDVVSALVGCRCSLRRVSLFPFGTVFAFPTETLDRLPPGLVHHSSDGTLYIGIYPTFTSLSRLRLRTISHDKWRHVSFHWDREPKPAPSPSHSFSIDEHFDLISA